MTKKQKKLKEDFMIKYRGLSDKDKSDILLPLFLSVEPYSWNAVAFEVQAETELSFDWLRKLKKWDMI